MIKCPVNKVLVTIEKKYNDEINLKSGVKLYLDTSYNPEQHVTIMGKVVSVPEILTGNDNKDIVPVVEPGDDICFNYQVISHAEHRDSGSTYHNLITHEGQEYWQVDYFQIFFVVRNGEILPVGGMTILEPVIEEKGEKFENSILFLPEMNKKIEHRDRGLVKYIGLPNFGHATLDVKKGDTVFFERRFCAEYEVFDKKHFFIKQDYLIAKNGHRENT